MVASSIVITLLFSFAPFVDWGKWVGITCACYWCCWNIHFLVLLLPFTVCFSTHWHTTPPSFIRPFSFIHPSCFIPFCVETGAHLGGAIMGLLLALVLLTDQLDNKSHGRIIRIGSLAAGATNHTCRHTRLTMHTHYHTCNQHTHICHIVSFVILYPLPTRHIPQSSVVTNHHLITPTSPFSSFNICCSGCSFHRCDIFCCCITPASGWPLTVLQEQRRLACTCTLRIGLWIGLGRYFQALEQAPN